MRWQLVTIIALVTAGCRLGFDAAHTADPDAALDHVSVAAGYSVSVFHDFSARHEYIAEQFLDTDQLYSNAPTNLVILDSPFAQRLAVIAGRELIELSATDYIPHDYGAHAADTAGLPDHISDATMSHDFAGGGPTLLVTSLSRNTGDGVFAIAAIDWLLTEVSNRNNTHSVAWDATGTFDALGVPTAYVSTNIGIRRIGDNVAISASDTRSFTVVGDELYVVETASGTAEQLVRIASSTHAATQILHASSIQLAAGERAPSPAAVWAITGLQVLVQIDPAGNSTTIGESRDPLFVWRAAAVPSGSHPLGGSLPVIYVLEENRTRDIDRVLRIARD